MDPKTLHDRFEEGRRFPRIRINTQVAVQYGTGREILADVHDISPEGMQIRCTEGTALQLHPRAGLVRENDRIPVQLQFSLPVKKTRKSLLVTAKIVYMIVLGDTDMKPAPGTDPRQAALGLHFQEFKGRSHSYLKEFLFNKNIYIPHWAEIDRD